MNKQEKKSVLSLALLFSFRMLGLFLILPIFSLYAEHLDHATPTLIGIALGIYGLTQGLLQMPLGILSDKFGRKPIIAVGLVLFALGSSVAALSHDIYGIIIGRALQGAGAIGSTILAFAADVTREEYRAKAMAIIGITIGFSFSIAMALSSLLNACLGISGIFWLTAAFALLGLLLLFKTLPTPPLSCLQRASALKYQQLIQVIKNPVLLRLDFSIFVLHAVLTALFLVVPSILKNFAILPVNHEWIIYLPVMILSFILMYPFMELAEKKAKMEIVFLGAILMLLLSQSLIVIGASHFILCSIGLLIFFTAFTLLEALLPSLISKVAPAANKGAAIGLYSSCQFLGIFAGGALGGWIYSLHQMKGVFLFCMLLTLIWLAIMSTMTTLRVELKPVSLSLKE